MKAFVKRLFKSLGYEITRASKPAKHKGGHVQHNIEFVKDDKFVVEFTHITLDGNQYFVPRYALHRPAVRNLLNGTLYEPDTHRFVMRFCKSFKGSIVHAGTFFGDMIPNFSGAVSGTVYAFEPVLENYILAKLCVEFNKLENVVLMNCALSKSIGNLHIDSSEDNGRHAGGASKISKNGRICAAISIDSLDINDLLLIQLDVEGHELPALIGAKRTIEKNRPVIAIEDNNKQCSDLLLSIRYETVSQVPGLTIWSPSERSQYKEKILSILS